MARTPRSRSKRKKRRGEGAALIPGAFLERWGAILALGIALAVLATQAFQMWQAFGGHAVDDAYISYRYAENLAGGHGLVWNHGERVEGFSNFLWTIALSPFAAVFGDLTLPSQILGFLLACAAVALALNTLRQVLKVESPWAFLATGLLIGSSGYWAAWCVSGMESALHGFLLLWAWSRFATEHVETRPMRPISAIPILALALLRPEGIFVAVAAVAVHLWLCWRRGTSLSSFRALALPVAIVAPLVAYHGFRVAYYGPHLWPNSVRAKVGLSADQLFKGLEHVAREFLVPYAPMLLGLGLLGTRFAVRQAAAMGCALLLGYLAFVAVVGGDWSHGRFYAPLLPLGAVLSIAAIARWSKESDLFRTKTTRAIVTIVTLAWCAWAWHVTGVEREHPFRVAFAGKDAERIEIGRWLAREAPPDTIVAVYAAGQIPYYSRLPSHDMLGLNDAHIASVEMPNMGEGPAGHERFDVRYTLERVRPAVIVDPHLIPGMLQHPSLRRDYTRKRAFVRNLVMVKRGFKLHFRGSDKKWHDTSPWGRMRGLGPVQ